MKKTAPVLAIAAALSASMVWGVTPGRAPGFDAGRFFTGRCSGCHAVNGRGNPRAATKLKADLSAMDLQGAEAKGKTAAELSSIILKGNGRMPSFKKSVSEAQAAELVANIRNMGTMAPAEKSAKGRLDGGVLFTARSCANCHGKDGKGIARVAKMLKADAGAMDLTGDEAKGRTDAGLAGIIVKGAAKGKMPAYGVKMTREEIDAVVAYIRSKQAAKHD